MNENAVQGGERTLLRLLPGLLVSAVAVVVILWVLDLRRVGAAFGQAHIGWLAAALPVYVTSLLSRAMTWHTLLERRATLRQAFDSLNQGYLFHNMLPLRLGEFARCFLLARVARLPFLQVFPTVVIERVFDVLIAVGLLLGTVPFVWGAESSRQLALAVGALVVVALAALVVAAAHRERVAARVTSWTFLGSRLRAALADLLSGLAALASPARAVAAFAWLAFSWLQGVVVCWLLLRAFVPHAPLLYAAFGIAVMGLGIALPSSPASVGVYEAAWIGALALCGVDHSRAFAFALTSHVLMVAATTVFAVWAFLRQGESIRTLYHDVRRQVASWRTRRNQI
jgi:uncharacterized protein (TIRG00374 family)